MIGYRFSLPLIALAACMDPVEVPDESTDPGAVETRCDYRGGAFVSFGVLGESFRVWATDPAFISNAERQLAGAPAQVPILTLKGKADCSNPPVLAPRNWHAVPSPMTFADSAVELCDAVPSYVDTHVDDLVASGFCPWSARVISVVRQ